LSPQHCTFPEVRRPQPNAPPATICRYSTADAWEGVATPNVDPITAMEVINIVAMRLIDELLLIDISIPT
jgi:hypothetical protein